MSLPAKSVIAGSGRLAIRKSRSIPLGPRRARLITDNQFAFINADRHVIEHMCERPWLAAAFDAGFSNVSNFNRRFGTARPMTPKEFRNYYLKHGRTPELDHTDLTKRSPSLDRAEQRTVRRASRRVIEPPESNCLLQRVERGSIT